MRPRFFRVSGSWFLEIARPTGGAAESERGRTRWPVEATHAAGVVSVSAGPMGDNGTTERSTKAALEGRTSLAGRTEREREAHCGERSENRRQLLPGAILGASKHIAGAQTTHAHSRTTSVSPITSSSPRAPSFLPGPLRVTGARRPLGVSLKNWQAPSQPLNLILPPPHANNTKLAGRCSQCVQSPDAQAHRPQHPQDMVRRHAVCLPRCPRDSHIA